jgi:hypothetical protein
MMTHETGPTITFGYGPSTSGNVSASGLGSATGGSNPDAGPNVDYQGSAVLDVRWPYYPGKSGRGQVVGSMNYAYACLTDCVPGVKSTTIVAAAQAPAVPAGGSVALTLASTNQISPTSLGNRAVNVPIVPFGQQLKQANAVNTLCLDPGHTTGTTSTSSPIVTAVADIRLITPGQYVGLPGAGSGGTWFSARVLAKTVNPVLGDGSGTITLDTTPGAVVTNGPIILMEWRSPNDTTGGASAVPWYYQGASALLDPHTVPGRLLTVTSTAADTTFAVSVTSYDIFGVLVHETITLGSTTTVTGKKAHKYLVSAALVKSGGGTMSGTVSIGTADAFGFPMKNELWEYTSVFWAGAFVSVSTGWTAAVGTNPATATTGDTRGTYALQSAATGTGTAGRFAAFMSLPARQLLASTYDDPTPLFGILQA